MSAEPVLRLVVDDEIIGDPAERIHELNARVRDLLAEIGGWRTKYSALKRDRETDAEKHASWARAYELFVYWQEVCDHPRARWPGARADRFWMIEPFLRPTKADPQAEIAFWRCKAVIASLAKKHYVADDGEHFTDWEHAFGSTKTFERRLRNAPAHVKEKLTAIEAGNATGAPKRRPSPLLRRCSTRRRTRETPTSEAKSSRSARTENRCRDQAGPRLPRGGYSAGDGEHPDHRRTAPLASTRTRARPILTTPAHEGENNRMATSDLNVVNLIGRLTRDPELKSTTSGQSVCSLRLAFSSARKTAGGDWEEKSNYVDVTVWGNQADAVGRYMHKGSQVAITGRLDFQEWTTDSGDKRSKVQVVANQVQFIGGKDGGDPDSSPDDRQRTGSSSSAAASMGDDDIPF